MTSTDIKENYTGKLSFYIFKKNSRNPLFLQRNVRCVLAHHRKRLGAERAKQSGMKGATPLVDGHVEPKTSKEKKWSPREIIHILERKVFSERDPVLRIDVTAIRDRFAKFREAKDSDEPPKKQAKVSPVEATCSLTIWDSTSGNFDTVVEQTRRCEIFQGNKSSGERYASIELAEAFVVSLQKLLPKRDRATQTYGEQSFSMQLALMAANSTDRWPPVDTKIPPPKTPQYRDPTGHLVRFPILVAKWLRLPRVPENESESLLELFASQDQTKYKPKLSLKINAQWMQPPTPLTVYNSEFKHGLASPGSSSRSTSTYGHPATRPIVKTDWVFEGIADFMDRLSFDGYTCPLCNGRQFRAVEEFHFHLVTGHDVFKFVFTVKFGTDDTGQSTAAGIVQAKIAEPYEKKLLAKPSADFREMTWVKPECPFDLEAFLKGDETWLGSSTRRAHGSLLVPPPQLERSSSREVARDIPAQAVSRPPAQVPDLVPSIRKKFKVPRAPQGMRFYRTIAKCPLDEGDEVSESDDNIDEEWLLEKHRDTIDSFTDTLPQEKEFMQLYDRHMLREDVSSDLHSGEALIRFCRANKTWLQKPSMRLEFSKKSAALKLQGALSRTTIRACLDIINSPTLMSPENEDTMEVDTPPTPASREPHSAPISDGLAVKQPSPYRPLTPPEIGHIYGRCAICNDAILDMRKNIRCANHICQRTDHHLSCVGLEQRDPSWACDECKTAGFVPESDAHSTHGTASTASVAPGSAAAPTVAAMDPPTPIARASADAGGTGTAPTNGKAAGNRLAIRSRESSPSKNASREGSNGSRPAYHDRRSDDVDAMQSLDEARSGMGEQGGQVGGEQDAAEGATE